MALMIDTPASNMLHSMAPSMNLTMDSDAAALGAKTLAGMLDMFSPAAQQIAARQGFTKDSAYATGNAFVTGQFEKINFNLNEPLTGVTWFRDVDVEMGGGLVDYTSLFFVDYATAGTNQYGLMNTDTNVLPTIQTNISKDVYKVNRFGYTIKIPLIDQQRMAMTPWSLEQLLSNGLRLNYDKMLDQNVYFGFPTEIGTKGLLNQSTTLDGSTASTVYLTYSAANGSGNSRFWKNKTPDQILTEFNDFLLAIIANTQYAISSSSTISTEAIPNHVVMPWPTFTMLNTRLISTAGSQSILTYLKDNNICKALGVDLNIVPARQCNEAGTDLESGGSTTGRIVAYKKAPDQITFDETVPLTRMITMPDANQVAYLSTYIASVGQLKIRYYQAIGYLDGTCP